MIRHVCLPLLALGVIAGCGPQEAPVSKALAEGQGHVALKPITSAPEGGGEAHKLEPKEVMLGAPELLAGIPGEGPVTVAQIQAWLDTPDNHVPLELEFPCGWSRAEVRPRI
jgi:hypothetical protein